MGWVGTGDAPVRRVCVSYDLVHKCANNVYGFQRPCVIAHKYLPVKNTQERLLRCVFNLRCPDAPETRPITRFTSTDHTVVSRNSE
jgi:hypothetical protein